MLVDDATFQRLCRARDLLAASYNSHVPLELAAREARRWIAPVHGWRVVYLPTCFVNFWLSAP